MLRRWPREGKMSEMAVQPRLLSVFLSGSPVIFFEGMLCSTVQADGPVCIRNGLAATCMVEEMPKGENVSRYISFLSTNRVGFVIPLLQDVIICSPKQKDSIPFP